MGCNFARRDERRRIEIPSRFGAFYARRARLSSFPESRRNFIASTNHVFARETKKERKKKTRSVEVFAFAKITAGEENVWR